MDFIIYFVPLLCFVMGIIAALAVMHWREPESDGYLMIAMTEDEDPYIFVEFAKEPTTFKQGDEFLLTVNYFNQSQK